MIVSTKGRYALRVMINFAQRPQGEYVPLKETIRSFKEIIEGKHDDIPESYFLFAGSIDEVVAKFRGGEKA